MQNVAVPAQNLDSKLTRDEILADLTARVAALAALGRTPGLGTALDLGACAPALVGQPASVLDGARFTVTIQYGRNTAVVPGPQIRLGIWDLHLQVNTERSGGTGATANGWNNPAGALDYDDADVAGFVASTGSGIPPEAAKYGSWAVPDSTRTFTVTGIEPVEKADEAGRIGCGIGVRGVEQFVDRVVRLAPQPRHQPPPRLPRANQQPV